MPNPVQSQTPAKNTATAVGLGAFAIPKLTAVTGVTTPMMMNAAAIVLSPVASSFVC